MNKKQKLILALSVIIISASFIVWLSYGSEIFTKTQVLIESKDELFGWTEKKWVDQFIWGLDLTLSITGITILASGVLMFFMRSKKK